MGSGKNSLSLLRAKLYKYNLVTRAFSSFKMADRRNPWLRLPTWLQKFVRISSRKHDETSSFRLKNGFRLQKTNRAARRWKQPPKKPFHHVSRDKILHDSWSSQRFLRSAILNEENSLGTRLIQINLCSRDCYSRCIAAELHACAVIY